MSEERARVTQDAAKGLSEERTKARETQEKRAAQKAQEGAKTAVSETWAEETIADLDEFIESQGIYIRQ